jgi:hypothetical protein
MVRNKTQFEALVMEILKGFNGHHIHGNFLDPVAGTGQFVSVVEEQKRAAGLSDDEIRATTFGFFETSMAMNNAKKTHKLVGTYEVLDSTDFIAMFSCKNISSLTYYSIEFRQRLQNIKDDIIMKFDAIAGNPPFQEITKDGKRKDKASNLWSKFWSVAIKDLSKDDGVIGLITPTTWISPSRDLVGIYRIGPNKENKLWNVFNQYSSYANIDSVKQYFPTVGSSFGYVIVDKSKNDGLVFSNNIDTSLGFLHNKVNTDEFSHEIDFTNNLGAFIVDQRNTPKLRVCIPMTRKITVESIQILDGDTKPTGGHENAGLFLYIYPSTIEGANAIRERLISIKSLLNTACRFSGWLNIQMVKNISYNDIK